MSQPNGGVPSALAEPRDVVLTVPPAPAGEPSTEVEGSVRAVMPSGLPPVFAPVADELSRLETHLRDAQSIAFPLLSQLLELIFASGGKRIRPAIVFATAHLGRAMGTGAPGSTKDRELTDSAAMDQAVLDLAAAVETLHAATLVHDDLVDGALLRRGQPTLNTRWSAGATVLAGDWLFARAAQFAAATRNVEVVGIFARELGTLTDGELRQLFGRAAVPSTDDYAYRIYAKTASLFEAATEATGAIFGMEAGLRAEVARFGRELGMAFQVVDDILDFTADQAKLGKPVGHDLRSGTVTLPTLRHLATHPDAGAWLHDGSTPSNTAIDALVQAIREDEDAIEGSWQVARSHVELACAALDAFPPSPERDALIGIAWYAVERTY